MLFEHRKGVLVFLFLLMFVSAWAQEKDITRASLPENHSLNMLFTSLKGALDRKEHKTAFDVTDSIKRFFEKNGDKFVVRVGSVYYGARLLLQRLLATLSEEGVETFSAVFLDAELLLERAKEEPYFAKEVLSRLASRSQLKESLKMFIPYCLERGEFAEALRALQTAELILGEFEDERIEFYAAAVHAALGRLKEARRIVSKVKGTLRLGGRKMSASEALEDFIKKDSKKRGRPKLPLPGLSRSVSLQSPFDDSVLEFTATPVLPLTVGDTILLNTAKEVCRLNREGTLWSVQLVMEKLNQAYLYSRPFRPATDGTLVFFTDRERLFARRLDDGSFVWSSDSMKNSIVLSPPVVDGSDVFVYAVLKERELKAVLFCFDAQTGGQKWFVTIATGFPQNPFNATVVALPPVVVGERIFVVTSFEVFCAISKDGRLLWAYRYPTAAEYLNARRVTEGVRRRLSLPIVCGENIVAIPPDSVFAFAFSTKEPKIVWRLPSTSEYSLGGICRVEDGEVALFGTALLILDSATGIIKKFIELPSLADSALVDESSLWLLSNEGKCIFRVGDEGVEEFFIPELQAGSVCGALNGRLFVSSPREVLFFGELSGAEDGETEAIRRGSVDPNENPELYERWRKGVFGALLRRIALEDAVAPILKRWRRKRPLMVARILRKLSGLLTPEDAGRILLDSALLSLASRRYKEALETLSEVVDSSAEVVSFGSFKYLPMPQTSAALALLTRDRLSEESLRDLQRKASERLRRAETSSDMKRVFFAYPYTTAGMDAALDAARKLIASKRTEEAERWLLSVVGLPVSKELRAEALKLLIRIYRSVGDEVRVRWAEESLEEVEKGRPLPQPDSLLWLPIKLAWRTLPFLVTDEEMEAVKLRVGGRGAILRYGETIMDAIDAENGALLWRLNLRHRASLPLQRSDGRVLVLSGDTLALVDEKSGDVLKRVEVRGLDETTKNEGTVRMFESDNERVCLLDGAGNLLCVDTGRGEVIWRRHLTKCALEKTSSIGRTLLVVDETAVAVSLVDLNRGIVTDVVKAEKGETILEMETADECFYLLFTSKKGQSIGAYTAEGRLLWRKRLDEPASGLRILSDGTVLSVPERTALRPTFSAFDADGASKWKYALEAPSLWLKTTECNGKLLVLLPKGGGNSECRVVDAKNGVEKERIVLGIDNVGLFFSSGNFAVAVEDSLYLPSVEVLDVRRASVVGTLLSLDGLIRTGISSAGVVMIMNASGTVVALCPDIEAPSDAASAAARLLLGDGAKAASKYARALTPLGELDAAASMLDTFLSKNSLYSNPKDLARIETLLAETVFSAALRSAPTVDVWYTPCPPDIDGSLQDEWQRAKVLELSPPAHLLPIQRSDTLSFRWFSEEDLAAKVYLMWDEKAFYALLDVSDQSQRPFDDSEKLTYKGDMLYVAVEDVLIYIGLMVPQPRKDKEEEKRSKPKGKYMVKRKSDNSGFIYELSMPWDYLKKRGVRLKNKIPSAGDSFKLNFAVVDDDTGLGSEKTLNLAPGLCCGRRDVIWRGFIKKAFATAVLRK